MSISVYLSKGSAYENIFYFNCNRKYFNGSATENINFIRFQGHLLIMHNFMVPTNSMVVVLLKKYQGILKGLKIKPLPKRFYSPFLQNNFFIKKKSKKRDD